MSFWKRVLIKTGVYFGMIGVGVLAASLYGALHDQITYTLSPDYFFHLKFDQFGLDWAFKSPRLGAAVVGVLATWWMGILIAVPLGWFAALMKEPRQMARKMLHALLLVTVIALLVGLVGYGVGVSKVTPDTIDRYSGWIRDGVEDPVQFVRVGFMHNASYLGGGIGLLAGIGFLLVSWLLEFGARRRARKAQRAARP